MNKQWQYFFILIGILAIAIALLSWSAWKKAPEQQETPPQIVQHIIPSYEVEPRKFQIFEIFEPLRIAAKPLEEIISHNPSQPPLTLRGGDEENSQQNNLPNLPLDESPVERGEGGAEVRGTFAQGVMKSPPTEQEIFDWVWPKTYRDDLANIEALYMRQGYITSRAPTNFDNENNIYQFLAETLTVSESKGWVTVSDAQLLRKGLREMVPVIVERDKEMLRQGLWPISLLPKDMPVAQSRWMLFANIAQASPGWVTSGDCYKDDDPDNKKLGPNIWAECCNCGLFCTPTGCDFVKDCGQNSVKCDVPLGCLNLTCEDWQNAIWDPATGICGCG